ncbi:MAG: hypothetical protein HC916_20400 [Coleofasciculaceae cyanobacterium SM2_1_6]|nr:hypothetical protein [Coleofasciculaceae cyanobacterium SM2_1_6]
MLKAKSGVCLNLPILLLLGLSKYFLLSALDVHPVNGQSRTYFCQRNPSTHEVMVNFRGIRSLITWNPGEQARCDDVSNRFQGAQESGNLRFLVKQGNDICGTNTDIGGVRCSRILVSLDGVDRNSLLLRLFDGRLRISGAAILQSNGAQYINWEDLLRNGSLSLQSPENQQFSEPETDNQQRETLQMPE